MMLLRRSRRWDFSLLKNKIEKIRLFSSPFCFCSFVLFGFLFVGFVAFDLVSVRFCLIYFRLFLSQLQFFTSQT